MRRGAYWSKISEVAMANPSLSSLWLRGRFAMSFIHTGSLCFTPFHDMHLALTATCQKPHAQPAASISLSVVDLQAMLQGPFDPAAFRSNPTNQVVSMTDEAAFLSQFAIRTLINQELTITKPMGKAKKKLSCVGKQDDIIPETNFVRCHLKSPRLVSISDLSIIQRLDVWVRPLGQN
jgi:hypothetical protein